MKRGLRAQTNIIDDYCFMSKEDITNVMENPSFLIKDETYIRIESNDARYLRCIQIQSCMKIWLSNQRFKELKQNKKVKELYLMNVKKEDDGWNIFFLHKDDFNNGMCINPKVGIHYF